MMAAGSDVDIGHFAPVVVVDVVLGLFGWGVVHISAKVERQRGEHRVKRFGSLRVLRADLPVAVDFLGAVG